VVVSRLQPPVAEDMLACMRIFGAGSLVISVIVASCGVSTGPESTGGATTSGKLVAKAVSANYMHTARSLLMARFGAGAVTSAAPLAMATHRAILLF